MNVRAAGPAAGLAGGMCWSAVWLADRAVGDPAWGAAGHVVGLLLLGVALAAVGAGMVHRSTLWLRVVVALALPLLAWSVHTVVRSLGDPVTVDALAGLVAVVLGGGAWLRDRRAVVRRPPGVRGSHAAR